MEHVTLDTCPADGGFPVPLICPACGNAANPDSICVATGKPCVSHHLGIPRFLFGQPYWGETSSEKMARLLQRTRAEPWRSALREVVGDEPLYEHLLSAIRADALHAMPWNHIRMVLDVGAGMGFMSCDMAKYAKCVVAVEAVPQRAEFLQIRSRQDGLPVFPIIANALALPFPAESFDLITLNGAFEYLGLWGEGDPKQVQERFLRNALRLLKPGGYLYVGIESRYAAPSFLGKMDHSGLAFTNLMPRKIADLYCRLRSTPIYGAEHAANGYRTYTYTPSQYRKMFAHAGFAGVSVQGVFDGYNRQRVLYDIDDFRGRTTVLERINPAASFAGVLRRLVTENRLVYRVLEAEVIVLARKPPAKGDGPWSGLVSPGRTVVQVNLPFKILGIQFERGQPIEALETEKKGEEEAARRLEHSFDAVNSLQQHLRTELSELPIRWPAPRGIQTIAGRLYRRYEYISGESLSVKLLPIRYDRRAVPPLLLRVLLAYVSLCSRLSEVLPTAPDEQRWQTIESQLDGIDAQDDIRAAFLAAVSHARACRWRLSPIHGDFTASNLLVTPSNALVLIDWEHFTTSYFVGADLVRFFQDASADALRLPGRARTHFLGCLRDAVTAGLEAAGYSAADHQHLESLYIAQQIVALGGESRIYAPLLNAYREGQLFAPTS
jgi:SAM-dependent methyltransferase